MTYLGIDNGLRGGLVWLSETGEILRKEVMPTQNIGKNDIVDYDDLSVLLAFDLEAHVLFEGAAKFSQGVKALCSTWHSCGIVETTLKSLKMRWEGIDAQRWQKAILPGRKSGETKAAALATATKLWPRELWLETPRCSKPHDGMIDAALIAEYARRIRL